MWKYRKERKRKLKVYKYMLRRTDFKQKNVWKERKNGTSRQSNKVDSISQCSYSYYQQKQQSPKVCVIVLRIISFLYKLLSYKINLEALVNIWAYNKVLHVKNVFSNFCFPFSTKILLLFRTLSLIFLSFKRKDGCLWLE